MKRLFMTASAIALTLSFVLANAQTHTAELKHFAKDGLSFDYPPQLTIVDQSTPGGQHLILVDGKDGAQIMVVSRFEQINSPAQLDQARKEVFDVFVDSMVTEFQRQQAKVERVAAQTDVSGTTAYGVRLRAVLGGKPGNAEAYSLVLGHRLVLLTFIGSA